MYSHSQEQLRQQYLSAMGVTSWLPLRELPGAASSASWEWRRNRDKETSRSASPAVEAVSASAPATSVPAPQARSELKALLAGAVDAESVRSVAAEKTAEPGVDADSASSVAQRVSPPPRQSVDPVAVTPQVRTVQAATPRFSLALLQVQDLVVVNTLPPNRPGGLNTTHRRLLAEIIAVLGRQMGSEPIEIFNWPLVHNPSLDQGPDLARQGVLARLRKLSPQAPDMIMTMGEAAAAFVPEHWADKAPARLETQSLDQLLRIPGAKRELWLQLQDYLP